MSRNEQALVFDCEGSSLVAVLSGAAPGAGRGVPTLRFDYRGMGDSDGEKRTFESVGADIRCAIDRFFASVPGLKDVVIWGLCDAASAALFYAHRDARVSGLVLLNPWVRTEQGAARAHLRHYYLQRLFQASLWGKVARGEFDVRAALSALGRNALEALGRGRGSGAAGKSATSGQSLPARMADGLRRFRGKVLVILSGNDLTAQEFKDVTAGSRDWRTLLEDGRVTRHELPDANHTFAKRAWRDQVAQWTADWIRTF